MNPALTRHLAPSLLLAMLACAIGGTLLWAAQQAQTRTRQETQLAREAAQALHQRHMQTQQEEGSIRAAIAHHDALLRSGLIGAEDRLSWVDALRTSTDRLRLPPSDFSLAPQRPLAPRMDSASFRFHASEMKLGTRLLHEVDLLTLLDNLYQLPSVLVLPQRCGLQPLPTTSADNHAGLRADCQLDWITITTPEQL